MLHAHPYGKWCLPHMFNNSLKQNTSLQMLLFLYLPTNTWDTKRIYNSSRLNKFHRNDNDFLFCWSIVSIWMPSYRELCIDQNQSHLVHSCFVTFHLDAYMKSIWFLWYFGIIVCFNGWVCVWCLIPAGSERQFSCPHPLPSSFHTPPIGAQTRTWDSQLFWSGNKTNQNSR